MKIGAFAKKFGLNVSTVRYYINTGLLLPERKSGQYEFGKNCEADMATILKYKDYHFSLEEIQLLFFLEKASRFQDELVLGVCADILNTKRKELIEEREQLTHGIAELENEIASLPRIDSVASIEWGVPFAFIPYLYCPRCQSPLKLDSANLANGYIYSGDLNCDCGYSAKIEDGIIFSQEYAEDTPFKAFDNVDSVISMKDEFSASYRSLISKAYLWMYNQIPIDEPLHILTGPFTFNFLLEYIEKLGNEHTYIISDPSIKRITKMMRYLHKSEYQIIFIVGDVKHIPIKHKSLDHYIDDYSLVNSLFTYNNYGTEFVAPLLKRHGQVTGIYTDYKKAPKSLKNFKDMHPRFSIEKMKLSILKGEWGKYGVNFESEKVIGETTGPELDFPQSEPDEPISVITYHAKKSPSD